MLGFSPYSAAAFSDAGSDVEEFDEGEEEANSESELEDSYEDSDE